MFESAKPLTRAKKATSYKSQKSQNSTAIAKSEHSRKDSIKNLKIADYFKAEDNSVTPGSGVVMALSEDYTAEEIIEKWKSKNSDLVPSQ